MAAGLTRDVAVASNGTVNWLFLLHGDGLPVLPREFSLLVDVGGLSSRLTMLAPDNPMQRRPLVFSAVPVTFSRDATIPTWSLAFERLCASYGIVTSLPVHFEVGRA